MAASGVPVQAPGLYGLVNRGKESRRGGFRRFLAPSLDRVADAFELVLHRREIALVDSGAAEGLAGAFRGGFRIGHGRIGMKKGRKGNGLPYAVKEGVWKSSPCDNVKHLTCGVPSKVGLEYLESENKRSRDRGNCVKLLHLQP